MNTLKLTIPQKKVLIAFYAVLALLGLVNRVSSQTVSSSGDKFSLLAYLAYRKGEISLSRAYLDSVRVIDTYAMYVRAALTEDANEAADIYREIVMQNQSQSVSRDALIQLYNYHYAIGDYRTAHLDYLSLQKFPLMHQVRDPAGLSDTLPQLNNENVERELSARLQNNEVAHNLEEADNHFVVQVGIFSTKKNALQFVENLAQKGLKCNVFEKIIEGKSFYAVSAGMFAGREAADTFAASLRARSINCFVVKK